MNDISTLQLVWGGASCFIALCSLLVSVFAWKTSASSKHLDEKIELAIQRFENSLDTKLANSFSTEANVRLRFEIVEKEITSLDLRLSRNTDHISLLLNSALSGSLKPSSLS